MAAIKFASLVLQLWNREAQRWTESPKIMQPVEDKDGLGVQSLLSRVLTMIRTGTS